MDADIAQSKEVFGCCASSDSIVLYSFFVGERSAETLKTESGVSVISRIDGATWA